MNKIVLVITVLSFILTSCKTDEGLDSVQENKLHQKEEKIDKVDELYLIPPGEWKIDSTDEDFYNNVHVPETEQFFDFKKDFSLWTVERKQKFEESRKLGSYKFNKDSIYFLTPKENIFMRLKVVVENESIVLISGDAISESNPAKLTYFLSKRK